MIPSRNRLVAFSALAALSILFASTWIARIDRAAAQGAGEPKQAAKNDAPSTDLAVFKALDVVTSIDVAEMPIQKALKLLDEKTGKKLNMLFDEPSLKEANVDVAEKNVTLKMTRFTLRSILRKIFEADKLDYYIEDGSLRITTAEVAQKKMVIRFYPVRNLTTSGGGGGFGMMAMMQQAQAKQNAQSAAMLIMSTVEPTSYWFINGGPGQLDWDAKSMSLAVKASIEMHLTLAADGLKTVSRTDVPANSDTRVTRVYNIAGLLDPKRLERSSEELMKAVTLVVGLDESRPSSLPWNNAAMGIPGMGMMGGGMPSMPGGVNPWGAGAGGGGLLGNGGGFIGGGLFPNQAGGGAAPNGDGGTGAPRGLPISTQPANPAPQGVTPVQMNPMTGTPDMAPMKTTAKESDAPTTTSLAVILPHLDRLVVRQTPQVHQEVERLINDLKAGSSKAPAPK